MSTQRPLDVYLTMGDDGFGVLTMFRPQIAPIRLTRRKGIYARAGDPVLIRHLCQELVELVLGELPLVNVPVRCRLTLERLDVEAG